jgi:hypothetical protein
MINLETGSRADRQIYYEIGVEIGVRNAFRTPISSGRVVVGYHMMTIFLSKTGTLFTSFVPVLYLPKSGFGWYNRAVNIVRRILEI